MRASRPALLACLVLGLAPAHAQDKDRERAQIQRLQQQLSALQREKSTWQAEKSQLEEKLKAAGGEADKLKGSIASAAGRAQRAEKDLAAARKDIEAEKLGKESAEKRLADLQRRFEELTARHKALGATLQTRDDEAKTLAAKLAAEEKRYSSCAGANARLYAIGGELLERYERKGCAAALLEREPFTQVKRTELENLIEDYRDRLEQERLAAPKPK